MIYVVGWFCFVKVDGGKKKKGGFFVGKKRLKTKLTPAAKAKAAQAMELDNWGGTCFFLHYVCKLFFINVLPINFEEMSLKLYSVFPPNQC